MYYNVHENEISSKYCSPQLVVYGDVEYALVPGVITTSKALLKPKKSVKLNLILASDHMLAVITYGRIRKP